MNVRWASVLPVLTIFALTLSAASVWGQGYPPPGAIASGPPPGMAPPPGYGGGMPPGYGPPGMAPSYGATQVGYMQPDEMMGGGGEGCPSCGGMGCPQCGGVGRHGGGLAGGLLGDILGLIGPYPDGGAAAPRWYDFNLEFMLMKRDDVGSRVDLASDGVNGPIVLHTQMFDFNEEPGFRFSAMIQCGPGSNLEFTYFGQFYYSSQAAVASPTNNLFSVLSDYGTNPVLGFRETDESDFQKMVYESDMDNWEINFRQRWQSANCRYQGSWLAGVRYFKLDEDFFLHTVSDQVNGQPAARQRASFNVNTNNSLTGMQFGGDVWTCILPGIRVGGELKAGVYGNHENVSTLITAPSLANPFLETIQGSDVSFIGQIDAWATYRINYQWTLKLGYTFMFIDGLALAPENFNTTPPAVFFNNNPPPNQVRTPFLQDDGNAFWHGMTVGAEYLW